MNDPEMRDVPEANKTVLGLYVLPAEAYALWKSDPDRVRVLDVRTFEEYIFGGHAGMAQKNIFNHSFIYWRGTFF